jgi:ABC-type nitrate/sulfonate/bicarbonate transport system substrate-binding protein
VHIVNGDALAKRRDTMNRFVAAYRKTFEWLYNNPMGVKMYAQYTGSTNARAAMSRFMVAV